MKSIIKIFLSVIIFISFFSETQAQAQKRKEPKKTVFTVNAGISLAGSLIRASDLSTDAAYSSNVFPVVQISADYYFAPKISVGAAGSYQLMIINYTDYGTTNYSFTAKIQRTNVGIRGLFHYVNKKHIDLYSGIRFGITNWNLELTEDIPDYEPFEYIPLKNGTLFSAQLVAFGVRTYFTPFLGINIELAVGAPHFLSAGLNLRF